VKLRHYFTSVNGENNLLLLIRYPFLTVVPLLQLLVTAVLNVTVSLPKITMKSKYFHSGSIILLHFEKKIHVIFFVQGGRCLEVCE
jgi:hypothetical protein